MDNSDICNRVVTIPQYLSTCWFNAILMAILYSQNSRKLLLYNNIYKHQKSNKLYQIINEILTKKYISVEKAIKYYHIMRPENILSNIVYNKTFLNRLINSGYYYNIFLPIFITYLGKTCITLDTTYDNNIYNINLMKSIGNIDFDLSDTINLGNININDIYTKSIIDHITNIDTNPDYIIVNKYNIKSTIFYYNKIARVINDKILVPNNIKFNKYKLDELNDTIVYNGIEYVLDSCLVTNFNDYEEKVTNEKLSHAVVGLSCKNKRYVYNGWIRTTKDANITNDKKLAQFKTKPCELMKFDWDVNKENMFCINPAMCKLDNIDKTDNNRLCFSFNDGTRSLIYVRKNENYKSIDKDISSSNKSSSIAKKSKIDDKKCPDGKILNPKTNRCIKIESYNKLYKKLSIDDKKPKIDDKKPKIDDKKSNIDDKKSNIDDKKSNVDDKKSNIDDKKTKIDDKKTKIDDKKPKIDDKKSNVDDKKSNIDDKKCPEGKILNPKTNRCIKIESYNKLYKKLSIDDKKSNVDDKKSNVDDKKSNVDDKKSKIDDKKCPEGKILNPKTNRCIKIESYNKLYKKLSIDDKKSNVDDKKSNVDDKKSNVDDKKSKIDDKKCPEGKILNPKTNRCIKIESFNKLYKK